MQQTAFDFNDPAYPRFDKLLGTANAELIYILQQEHDQFLYIWGEQGSGKSHILQAWVGQALQKQQTAVYIDAGTTPLADTAAQADFVAIDQIEKLTALTNMAKTRQLNIDPCIYQYLLDHWRQDLNSLITMFNDLANYSISQGKPITLPLLRRLLKQQKTNP